MSRYQHLQPQRLRALVEGAVAHLERARIRDAFADHVHDELRPGELFEIGGAGARHVQIGLRLAARRRADDAGVEKTPARSFDHAGDFMHGVRRDRIAVDDQRVAAARAQRIRCFAREIERGTRIHDREHDIAFGNESRNRTDVGQSRLARERTAALAALLQRGADIQALRFDLHRYRLPHVSGAHQADILDLHFFGSIARGGCC